MKHKLLLITILLTLTSCGKDMVRGKAGYSCSVSTLSPTQSQINCTDGTSAIITNGTNGTNGIDGTNGTNGTNGIDGTQITVLNPCGPNFNHDEVLLRLDNGTVIALFDGGPHQDRLTILIPNTLYVTTDDNNNQCQFSVDVNGNLL